MGEHAVLRDKPCLVAAHNLRLHVFLEPRGDQDIHIYSQLGEIHTSLSELQLQAPFQFVLAAIRHFKPFLKQGFDLKIHSEFSETKGLGSSSAVLIATTTALQKLCQHTIDIFSIAKKILLEVQGQGSGADLAAALHGGIVYYQIDPFCIQKLPFYKLPLVLVYSGSKKPTAEVIHYVNQAEKKDPERYHLYFEKIAKAVEQGHQALLKQDLQTFACALKENQKIMHDMQLSTPAIDHILQTLNHDPGIIAAKISGSGLGDCVIGLGELHKEHQLDLIPLSLSNTGLIHHD